MTRAEALELAIRQLMPPQARLEFMETEGRNSLWAAKCVMAIRARFWRIVSSQDTPK